MPALFSEKVPKRCVILFFALIETDNFPGLGRKILGIFMVPGIFRFRAL
jgi:hypothetical protein